MFYNYIITAFRSIKREKMSAFINIVGLSIGLACCLLIFKYLQFEWAYDKFHDKSDRIYIVNRHDVPLERDSRYNPHHNTTTNFALEIDGTIPGVEAVTRFEDVNVSDPVTIRFGNDLFEENAMFAEPAYFDIFSVNIIDGNRSSFLQDPNQVLLTEELAKKYFGDLNPINKSIEIKVDEGFSEYIVVGIIESFPSNSSQIGDLILSYQIKYDYFSAQYPNQLWNIGFSSTWVLLEEGANPADVEASFLHLMDELGITKLWKSYGDQFYHLQPITDLHMSFDNPRGFPTYSETTGSITLLFVGIVILLIACLNFIILSIGKSSRRVREIGIRKVLGAGKSHLIRQFFLETAIMVGLSFILSFIIAELALPLFNSLVSLELEMSYDLNTLLLAASLWLLIVSVIGLYPSLIMSRFPIMSAFRKVVQHGGKGSFRKSLVFVQFALSVCLIVATLIMSKQLKYIQNSNLGFNTSQIVGIPITGFDDSGFKSMELLKEELENDPDVEIVSGSACDFGGSTITHTWGDDEKEYTGIYQNTVDYNFLRMFDVKLTAGRDFSEEISTDGSSGMIVNEAFVKLMGWEDPIGQNIPRSTIDNRVIGVIEDYKFRSLHKSVEPLILTINPMLVVDIKKGFPINRSAKTSWYTIQYILIKIAPNDIPKTIERIKTAWQKVVPERAFNLTFQDAEVEKQYREDIRMNRIVTYSSFLAVMIAMLGLLGHSMIVVSQRLKEIGIRKVLGGSPLSIVSLLAKEITVIVLLANLVAWPVAYYVMNGWLNNFAFRIDINLSLFLLSGLMAMTLAWLVVGSLAWKATGINPIDTLRNE